MTLCASGYRFRPKLPLFVVIEFFRVFVINFVHGACCAPVEVRVMMIVRWIAKRVVSSPQQSTVAYLIRICSGVSRVRWRKARRSAFLRNVSSWQAVVTARSEWD